MRFTHICPFFCPLLQRLDLVASKPFTGVIRTAYVPQGVTPDQLDSYANTFATAGTVTPDLVAHGFKFQFQTGVV